MIIVMSSDEKNISGKIDLRFGRCKYFAIYDTQTKAYTFQNNEAIHSNQGAGIAAAQLVSSLKADVVLTGNLGPKALSVLQVSGIKGFKVSEVTLEEARGLFQNEGLTQIKEAGNPQK